MEENEDRVIFTPAERKSLGRLIAACSDTISRLSSDGDFLGWGNYYALQMWDDKLNGTISDLSDYIDDGDEGEDETEDKNTPMTVDEWLDAYGAGNSEEDD